MKQFKPLEKAFRLSSERLLLRPITEEDTDMVLEWRNASYVRDNFFYRIPITKEEHLSWVHDKCEKGIVFQFVVYVIEEGKNEPIGCVYLQHYNEADDSLESGVFFSEDAPKGKGYATEAVELMNRFAFETLGVSKTIARVIATNIPSLRLHERAGFVETARDIERIVPDNKEVEAVTFELLKGK